MRTVKKGEFLNSTLRIIGLIGSLRVIFPAQIEMT